MSRCLLHASATWGCYCRWLRLEMLTEVLAGPGADILNTAWRISMLK